MAMKLWGGRFKGEIDQTFARFNASFAVDRRLLKEDIDGSTAYAAALAGAGVLTRAEAAKIQSGLRRVWENARRDPAYLDLPAEDVHSFVEQRLFEMIGPVALKLHTGRSRNEQVSVDMRLYLRGAVRAAQQRLLDVAGALVDLARRHAAVVMPGYTHLQKAQPVLLAHYLLAYYEMIKRDIGRLADAAYRADASPLGCGALAGTSFPLDRRKMAADLGFGRLTENSLDAVSDRDFVAEFIAAAALAMVHLSRLAEDLILFATTEFGFITLGDAVSTGSSLMPQKKNPDALELIRGKAARVIGRLTAILTLLKGLPMSYNKDLQEDKEALFDAADTLCDTAANTAIVLRHVQVNRGRLEEALRTGYLLATDVADYLVKKGLEFRKAHELAGRAVLYAIERGQRLEELSPEEWRSLSDLFGPDVRQALTLEASLRAHGLIGGTSRARVRDMLQKAEKEIRSEIKRQKAKSKRQK